MGCGHTTKLQHNMLRQHPVRCGVSPLKLQLGTMARAVISHFHQGANCPCDGSLDHWVFGCPAVYQSLQHFKLFALLAGKGGAAGPMKPLFVASFTDPAHLAIPHDNFLVANITRNIRHFWGDLACLEAFANMWHN